MSANIVGYVYAADIYCPDHILAAMDHAELSDVLAEAALDRLARAQGIDRNREHTWDTDDFPKIILSVQACVSGTCNRCAVCWKCLSDGEDYDCQDVPADDELDAFIRGHRDAILWANQLDAETLESVEHGPGEYDATDDAANVTDDARDVLDSEAESFVRDLVNLSMLRRTGEDDFYRHGMDFALSRNGHGAGFRDRGYTTTANHDGRQDVGRALAEAAHTHGERSVVRNSDGSIETL